MINKVLSRIKCRCVVELSFLSFVMLDLHRGQGTVGRVSSHRGVVFTVNSRGRVENAPIIPYVGQTLIYGERWKLFLHECC